MIYLQSYSSDWLESFCNNFTVLVLCCKCRFIFDPPSCSLYAGVYPCAHKFKAVKTKSKQIYTCRTIPVNHWNCFASKLSLSIVMFILYKNRETLELFCQSNVGINELALALNRKIVYSTLTKQLFPPLYHIMMIITHCILCVFSGKNLENTQLTHQGSRILIKLVNENLGLVIRFLHVGDEHFEPKSTTTQTQQHTMCVCVKSLLAIKMMD